MANPSDKLKRAMIALEDGTVLCGYSFGAEGEAYGEAVFNTSLTGYQEIITDPSYKGQIVVMTYPLIGNYGVNIEDAESRKPFLEAVVVKEVSKITSNWRASESLPDYMKKNNIIGIEGVDTRKLTLHIRKTGAMRCVVSTVDLNKESLVEKAKKSKGLEGIDLVKEVQPKAEYVWNKNGKYHVAVLDCGVKYNILRCLEENDCRVTVVPAKTPSGDILKLKIQGVLLSNGPGDPSAVPYVVNTTKELLGKIPIFGICLGHQMLGQALGGKTFKLKFGHHGGNHPVKDLKTGKVSISVQNHGFCVDMDTLNKKEVELTHINLNDKTLEGMRHKKLPVFSVQFHPEAGPGPHDARYLFKEFTRIMESEKRKAKN
ncbi:MAG: glutamine-hydrolyzing carbamoyl-phosphate synthase small subunit [Candidatus Omnitrophica bacterium]|jgi:carbamoyl-phosphate synthase small subunit|nr:glutamine-hydrolyzing carbamoyl-phosphate synthase small subunit [Candidatus Omnitrophota bacterium]